MKHKRLLGFIAAIAIFTSPHHAVAQAPALGTAANFVLFTSVGSVSNTGISQITGNVGSNSGSSTAFGNVNGVMHDNDAASAQCATDLHTAYLSLNTAVPAFFPAPLLGNGQVLTAGVYSISSPAVLNLSLTLDGQGNPNAVFIFQIQGAFSTNASAKVHLIHGALACNVFWKVEGLVSMAAGTTMRGTIVANNSAISMGAGDTLEGRALSTSGAVTIDGLMAYTPIGCGSTVLTGPLAPNLASAGCYGVFTSIGPVTNTATSYVSGDVGSNNGLTTGFNPLFVTGTIHSVPDGSTAACSTDLLSAYNYLNALPYDIELLYPAQFGNGLVLTPHTYIMNSAVTFTDTLFLNAEGDANAVFVIKVNGAFSTSTYSRVKLINGTQPKNIYWAVSGAVSINTLSVFCGTMISNNGAINIAGGDTIQGRLLSTNGAINTTSFVLVMPPGCPGAPGITTQPGNQSVCSGSSASFTVTATGNGLTYQWRKGNTNLVNGGNISGATTPTLTINPATISDTSSFYNVIISGAYAPLDTSSFASLKVSTSTMITSQPSNQSVCSGNSASFIVAATGGTLSYQWRIGTTNLINGGGISGATTATLTINPVTAANVSPSYNVVVTGSCMPAVTSADAALSINPPPSVNPVPNDTVCNKSVASAIIFSSTTGGTTYSWTNSNSTIGLGSNGTGNIPSFTGINTGNLPVTTTITVTPSSGGCTGSPVMFSITVNPSPLATGSSNSPVCTGTAINLTAQTVVGGTYSWTGPLTYSSAQQNPVINPAILTNSGNYILVVTAKGCNSAPDTISVLVKNCPSADLSVVKTVDNARPVVGHNVVFTITATDNGPDNATGVAVNDILQNGYVYISSSATAGTYNLSTGVWTIGNLNNGASDVLKITATVVAAGNYINTAVIYGNETDSNMVNNTSSIFTIPTDFFLPEGFSPNGDGVNDLFVVRGLDIYPNNAFSVFNRWGEQVFAASPYLNNWDGKSESGIRVGGNDLPVGTYFYILDLGDGSPVFKGTIYLNK